MAFKSLPIGWFERLLTVGGESLEVFEVRGIPTVVENAKRIVLTHDVLERLDDSLGMIEQYQPWRLAHLRRDLKHIRVMRYACRGAYFPELRACMVEITFLNRRDIGPATVASTIIHEGMHARVHRFGSRVLGVGLQHPSPNIRSREERLCRRAELDFGLSLPPEIGAPVVSRAVESLQMDDSDVAPAIDWNEAQRRIDDIDSRR